MYEKLYINIKYRLFSFPVRCLRQKKCRSINLDSWLKVCELNTASYLTAPGSMVTKPNASHFDRDEWHPVGL